MHLMFGNLLGSKGAAVVFLLGFTGLLPLTAGSAVADSHDAAVEVLLGDVSLNKLPFIIAYDEGIYARNGLSLIHI